MRNLLSLSFALAAAGAASAQVPMTTYGQGCPQPPAFYELFATIGSGDLAGTSLLFMPLTSGGYGVAPGGGLDTGFANNLGLTDDSIGAGLALTNPFPVPGDPRGTTSSIDVSSNGWVGLFAGDFVGSDISESVAELLSQAPRIATWWDDLNPGAGGAVYFDAMPGYDMVTWDSVPQFANTDANTIQLKLYGNGNFELTWAAGCTDDALVGWSIGNGAADPGATDLSAAVGSTLGGSGVPVSLSGTKPRVNGPNWDLDVTNIPSTAVLGIVNIGFSTLNFDLGLIGAPGCTGLAAGDVSIPLTIAMGAANVNLPSPTNPALIGGVLYNQALIADPGANTLGVVASNGVSGDILAPTQGIDITCQGTNSFNSDTTSGFFQVANNNTAGLSITSVTFDWVASSNPSQSTMVFDCDQTGMANTFDEGNGGGCGGTYRNGSDIACGLDLANALNNLANTTTCAGSVPHCQATNQSGTLPTYRTLTWHFTPGTFVNGLTFEFDIDTDGGAGIRGDNMAGMVVTVVLSDGSTHTGEVAAAGTNLGVANL